jgi:methionyl-tRNA formyltransferase
MGTPALAAHILNALLEASGAPWRVVAVVTQPDQPRGRGLSLTMSEVAAVAQRHGLPLMKPRRIRTPEFVGELRALAPDYLVIAAYGRILTGEILAVPSRLPLNVHASLLPRHRGAAPIQGALLAGDARTGVTIMRVVERMDAGPILLQRELPIAADDTLSSLSKKLAQLGAEALMEALTLLARGNLPEIPQDETQATYTALVRKADALIDWNLPAARIERMVRAYNPWPVAFTRLAAEEIRVYRASVRALPAALAARPGTILAAGRELMVQCGEGALSLIEVQAPGRKRVSGPDFARGRRLVVGATFDMAPPASRQAPA